MHAEVARLTYVVPAQYETMSTGVVVAGILALCGLAVLYLPAGSRAPVFVVAVTVLSLMGLVQILIELKRVRTARPPAPPPSAPVPAWPAPPAPARPPRPR